MACLRLVQCHASLCHNRLAPHSIPLPPRAWVSQSPWISCSFNPFLSGRGTDVLRRPTCRGGAKSKGEPQELCKQRRERETSPSSLRSSALNLHNQLDVPASVEYLNRQQIIPKLRWWTLGATIYIFSYFFSCCEYVCVCFFVWFCLFSFAFNICPRVLSVRFFSWFLFCFVLFCFCIDFSACYHWWICFLAWLLSSFFPSFFFYYFLIFFNF